MSLNALSPCHGSAPHPWISFLDAWEAHHESIHRRCLTWLAGRRDEADEAYSRTAVQAFQNWPELRDCAHAKAWLLAVARNVCMDLHRERRRNREISLDDVSGELGDAALSHAADPERVYVAREQRRHLHRSLQQLPARLRVTAELHFLREMRYRDVARELGISEMNVRKRIQKAKELLRVAIDTPHAAGPEERAEAGGAAEVRSLFALQIAGDDGIERDVLLELPRARRASERQLERLRRYIDRYPTGWRKRLELARALASAGRLAETVPHYFFALTKQPFPLAPWMELGAILEALGRTTEAVAVYLSAASSVGRDGDRALAAARAHAVRGTIDSARGELAMTPAAEQRAVRTQGAFALASGRITDAIPLLERSVALDPSDSLAAALCHDALRAAGRAKAAGDRLIHDASVPMLERRIAAQCRAGTPHEDLLEALRALAPERIGTYEAAARIEIVRGRWDEAERIALTCIERHPRNAGAWVLVARTRRALGQNGAAAAARRALEIDRTSREAWLALCRNAGASEAGAIVAEAGPRFGGDSVLLDAVADLASRAGDMRGAAALSHAAIAAQPHVPRFWITCGRALLRDGRDDAAIEVLLAAWTLIPADDAYHDGAVAALLLADACRRRGLANEAKAWAHAALLRAASLADTEPAVGMVRLGEALQSLGARSEARAAFAAAAGRHVAYPLRAIAEE